jgi:hypothetical protein
MNKITHALQWTFIIILFVLFSALIFYVEKGYLLAQYIVPSPSILLEEWLNFFLRVAFIGLGSAFIAVIFWYSWGTWLASFKKSQGFGKRLMWWIIFLLLSAVVIASICYTTAQEGVGIAHICYIFNTLGFFYLATVLFSPVPLKYYPPGARIIRRW